MAEERQELLKRMVGLQASLCKGCLSKFSIIFDEGYGFGVSF